MMSQGPRVTLKMIDWLLYNYPLLRDMVNDIEPQVSGSIMVYTGIKRGTSKVEKVAIKRASLEVVIDALTRALRIMHPELKKVYRMKYRAHLTHNQIAKRLYMSVETVHRRVADVREIVMQYLLTVPMGDLREFTKHFKKEKYNSF